MIAGRAEAPPFPVKQPIIVVDQLVKHYRRTGGEQDQLRGARRRDLRLPSGPNGAGKTTTLEIIETLRENRGQCERLRLRR